SMIRDSAVARRCAFSGEQGQGRGAGAGAVPHTKIAALVSLQIGSMPAAAYSMIAIDLSGPAKNAGHATDGLIGYEFFSQYVVDIDYRHPRMTMTVPAEFRAQANRVALPLVIDHKLPFVEAELKVPGV